MLLESQDMLATDQLIHNYRGNIIQKASCQRLTWMLSRRHRQTASFTSSKNQVNHHSDTTALLQILRRASGGLLHCYYIVVTLLLHNYYSSMRRWLTSNC